MKAPAFWAGPDPTPLARLMRPAGYFYSLAAEFRLATVSPARPLVPVVCVGNPTLGGAGKTPVALALAKWMKARGFKPGFLSRGYGANITKPVLVDRKGSAEQFGDEPLLLARIAPTVCSPNRAWGAEMLVEAGVDLIIMDDGFQNPTIAKDLSLLVVDGAIGLGNSLVFPAGPLRMRLLPQLQRASALVIIGPGAPGDAVARLADRRGLPVIRAYLQPDARRIAGLADKKLIAFAGIGRPEKFFSMLRNHDLDVIETHAFGDHAAYTSEDAERLLDQAKAERARLVTTQKDAARLAGCEHPLLARLRAKATALPVSVHFDSVATYALDKLLDTLPGGGRKKPLRKTRATAPKGITRKPRTAKAKAAKSRRPTSKDARTG